MIRNFVDETRSRARGFEKAWRALALGVAWSASAATPACAPDDAAPPADSSSDSVQALARVTGCESAAASCVTASKSASDLAACDAQLRTCLFAALPDAGSLLEPPSFPLDPDASPTLAEAGLPTLFDAAIAPPILPDAGGLTPPSPSEAGVAPPYLTDAGITAPALPDAAPPMIAIVGDGGALTTLGCDDAMRACLRSGSPAMQCADGVRVCLAAVPHALCDAGVRLPF